MVAKKSKKTYYLQLFFVFLLHATGWFILKWWFLGKGTFLAPEGLSARLLEASLFGILSIYVKQKSIKEGDWRTLWLVQKLKKLSSKI